ncbi:MULTISPECIES: hypothetical protein [Shewanella]|uniref:Uncharacterized protein n=1 Tax=Shewanella japonica TaxID=93973 RepID=A0ABM6JP58_9GAMM|nr:MULTISPECIES: hypothetical protein [Shewanella]ARD23969.1 hypothetical protein SJ2017_3728 [Shewanella japonica]KPZ72297.1 hypothetical protein AN944_01075 [Shewanella sp. P1-14-1]MBQ4889343.1 hypothetical protein [Shewanella sp. MMG014]OBT08104.1 hypothetical protein A9267_10285 [Shewanella sp. UCD-FRSSP16_17]
MKIQIIVALVFFAIFAALLPGTHYIYVANADYYMGQYITVASVLLMWISLFAGIASLFFHKIKSLYQSIYND